MLRSLSASAGGFHGWLPSGWDRRGFLDINDLARHTGWLQPIVSAYATYGVGLFALLLAAGWFIARRDGRVEMMAAAVWAPLGVLAAVAINQPIAAHVAEPRPYSSLGGVLVLVHRSTDFSFPSDHATMAGAVAAGLILLNRRLGLVATGAAVVMAFARVYVGAHYPSDVVAGLILGATIALAGHTAADTALTRIITRLRGGPLRPLLTGTPAPGREECSSGRPASIVHPPRSEQRDDDTTGPP